MQISVLIAKVSFFIFVFKILLTSLSINDFFNMIKYFVVGCFFNASLSRLAANWLSSSAKTLAKSSVFSGVQLRQCTFALLIFFTFLLLLRVFVGLFYKKSSCIMLPLFLRRRYCVWLRKPNLCKEDDYANILYFLCEHTVFLPFSHWLHNVTPGTFCKHHTYVDSAWKQLMFIIEILISPFYLIMLNNTIYVNT